jgi:Aminomethyltransferase folate-binding domain
MNERSGEMVKDLKRTPLNPWHKEHGGLMVEFAGWEMPVAYATGIIEEHLRQPHHNGELFREAIRTCFGTGWVYQFH